jgi:hypothetical protein
LSKAERNRVEGLLEDVSSLKAQLQVAKEHQALTETIDAMAAGWMAPHATKGLGDLLLEAGLAQGPDGIASGRLDVKVSRRVEVASLPIFGKPQTIPTTADLSPKPPDSVEPLGRDEQFAYSAMRQVDLGVDLSIRDFRETVRTPAGTVERDPAAVTGKATLAVTVTAVITPVKQEAIILDAVPNTILKRASRRSGSWLTPSSGSRTPKHSTPTCTRRSTTTPRLV